MNNQTDRQTEIMETTLNLISKKGIQGLTLKNISKKIGISEPAIYRHFASKTEILLAILGNFEDMAVMLSNIMKGYQAPASEKINFLFSKMLELFTESPSIVSVIFSEEIFKNEIVLKNKIIEILNLHAQTVETIILKGQEEKNVRTDIDARTLALIAMGSFRLLVKKWSLKNHDFNLTEEGKSLIGTLNKIFKP